MRRVFGLRFLVEAAFIVLVAAVVWHEDVSKLGIFGAIGAAWFLSALAEWVLSRRSRERPLAEPPVVTPPRLPEREPEPEPEPPPEPAIAVIPRAAPREWNLWELERVTREIAGADAARDEERSFLLMYLREFADPDGVLPVTFDPLVRETFGDVLGAARP